MLIRFGNLIGLFLCLGGELVNVVVCFSEL